MYIALSLRDPLRGRYGPDGADQAAEVAAHTFGADELGLPGFRVEDQGLVAAVFAGDGTSAAAYALGGVELGIDDGVAVQVGGELELGQELAYKV